MRAKTAALEAAQKQQATSSPTKGKKSNPFAAASDADSSSAAALVAAERAKMEKEFAEKMKQIEDEHSAQLAEEVTKATKAADDKVEAEVKRRLEELEANANEDSKVHCTHPVVLPPIHHHPSIALNPSSLPALSVTTPHGINVVPDP